MTIPTITPYPMPTDADVPPSAAGWHPDRRRAILLVHDMQRYFIGRFPSGQEPLTALLANVQELRRYADDAGIPVIYTAQPVMTRAQRGLLFDIWGAGMGADDQLRELIPEAGRQPADPVSPKWRYSAFHDSGLARTIAGYRRDQLIVCGVFAHIGCLITACDAFSRDMETFFVADAMADFSAQHHRSALDYASRLCAVTLTTRRLLHRLSAPVQAGPVGSGR